MEKIIKTNILLFITLFEPAGEIVIKSYVTPSPDNIRNFSWKKILMVEGTDIKKILLSF